MKKIHFLINLGIFFEISWLVLSYVAFLTEHLSNREGSIVIIFAS